MSKGKFIESASIKQPKEVACETLRQATTTRGRQEKSSLEQVMASPITKQIGKEIVRGVFGMLFGSAPRRRR